MSRHGDVVKQSVVPTIMEQFASALSYQAPGRRPVSIDQANVTPEKFSYRDQPRIGRVAVWTRTATIREADLPDPVGNATVVIDGNKYTVEGVMKLAGEWNKLSLVRIALGRMGISRTDQRR